MSARQDVLVYWQKLVGRGERLTFLARRVVVGSSLSETPRGVLRIITVVEHLQRVGSGLGRRDSIATVAAIRRSAQAQHAPTP